MKWFFLLLAACASTRQGTIQEINFGHFTWQQNIHALNDSKEIKNVLKRVHKDLIENKELEVVSKIEREGVLSTENKYKASENAIRGIPILFRLSLCSQIAKENYSTSCAEIARKNLMQWVRTYIPTGNPINESSFALLFVSIDLLQDKLSRAEKNELSHWLKDFVAANDSFYIKKEEFHTSRLNNHNTWRLVVRSFAATLINDKELIVENKRLIEEQVQNDLIAPPNWKPDSKCSNNAREALYGSFDFRQRDALHYHVYTLEAWIWLALMTPELLTKASQQNILKAIMFLKPYYLKEKTHVEFLCSKVKFDIERREAGIVDFSNEAWNPRKARKLLRLASAVYPEIKSWTNSVMDEEFDPWVKTLAEIQRFHR